VSVILYPERGETGMMKYKYERVQKCHGRNKRKDRIVEASESNGSIIQEENRDSADDDTRGVGV
jgi:hypothetical protein